MGEHARHASQDIISDRERGAHGPHHTDDEWFTPEEQDALILAVARGRREWLREELIAEADRLLHWAERVRIQGHLLDLVLDGKLSVTFDPNGAPRFYTIEHTPASEPSPQ